MDVTDTAETPTYAAGAFEQNLVITHQNGANFAGTTTDGGKVTGFIWGEPLNSTVSIQIFSPPERRAFFWSHYGVRQTRRGREIQISTNGHWYFFDDFGLPIPPGAGDKWMGSGYAYFEKAN